MTETYIIGYGLHRKMTETERRRAAGSGGEEKWAVWGFWKDWRLMKTGDEEEGGVKDYTQ